MSTTIDQRSDAWFAARAGKITASRFADAISFTGGEPGDLYKSGPKKGQPKPRQSSGAREKYMREIVFERLAETSTHEVGGRATKWGEEVEGFGREAVELETGFIIRQAEFVTHPRYPFIGASPDGLIEADGGYESKCPMDEAVHVNTLLCGMPDDHIAQVQGGMLVTERRWWLFASYDPRMCADLRLYTQRIERDDEYINSVLLPGLLQFEAEVNAMIKRLKERAA
ncbi:MAG: YqaJ-like viral recombinase [Paraburkholderia sp.]|uniref:lambda exonuclease family protein n=1 Tax=Paraburkholderia sp. TaxID=1926495 RepID=UPI00120821CA|nr:lambda exonuclease family protein [Paraburkholderia sp.]TAM07220.1 MAG: YqaJ-like viral recombinase [Paraburkholderia sp.]TAM32642.1 MAG: YqaJ-like viral recombinase [Paraburkholderia sp.]